VQTTLNFDQKQMRQRLVLLLISLFAFGWVIFSSYDLLSNENAVDFNYYFNQKDQTIYFIQDPNAFDWENEGMVTTDLNESLFFSILRRSKEQLTLAFSEKVTKLLIEKKTNWTKKEVQDLFKNGLFPFEMGKLKSFEYGKLHGRYNRNQLLIYEGELPSATPLSIQISSKASYAWLKWSKDHQIRLTETYRKKEGFYRYVKYENPNPSLRRIDDQAIFATVIPDFFKQYYFYEKNYVQQLDPNFSKTPWNHCIKRGFVHLTKDSTSLVIFDFEGNAHPIQTLNEYFHKEELNIESAAFQNLQFSSLIDETKNTWYVGVFGQFGFASPSKALLDESLAAASLGQTIAQNENKARRIYGNMPRKVSARWVDATQKKTVTLLGQQIVETSYQKSSTQIQQNQEKIRDYFVMNPGYRVIRFAAFAERGNVITLNENHQLVGYINGLRKWEKALQQDVSDLYQISGTSALICVQFEHEAQLYDKTGRLVYRLTHEAGTRIQVIENNGKKEFICSNGGAAIQLINENGAVIKQFSISGKLKELHSFKQNGKSFVSILTDQQMQFIDLTKRKLAMKQNADSTYVLVGNPNAAFAVKTENTNATVLSLEGAKQFTVPSNVQCIGAYLQLNRHILIFKRNKAIFALDTKGQRIWEKSFNAIELTQFSSFYGPDKKTLISFLDAVDNQIYLLDDAGHNLDTDKRHGEQAVQLSAFGNNAYSITTYLGNYIIQYTKQ
jgi:hypothetical protein